MLKSEKEQVIKELNDKFSKTTTAIVAEFSKLNVETVTKLRKKLREGGVDYRVSPTRSSRESGRSRSTTARRASARSA